MSILEFNDETKRDFVFTKGVLIHINPNALEKVYEKMYTTSQKYICMIEDILGSYTSVILQEIL